MSRKKSDEATLEPGHIVMLDINAHYNFFKGLNLCIICICYMCCLIHI